jgi:hypothetical protein
MIKKFIFIFIILISSAGYCSDWSTLYSEHKLLKNHIILAAGSIEKESRSDYNSYERNEWFVLNSTEINICFKLNELYRFYGTGSQSALLLVDSENNYRIAIFEVNLSSIKVTFLDISIIDCP